MRLEVIEESNEVLSSSPESDCFYRQFSSSISRTERSTESFYSFSIRQGSNPILRTTDGRLSSGYSFVRIRNEGPEEFGSFAYCSSLVMSFVPVSVYVHRPLSDDIEFTHAGNLGSHGNEQVTRLSTNFRWQDWICFKSSTWQQFWNIVERTSYILSHRSDASTNRQTSISNSFNLSTKSASTFITNTRSTKSILFILL